MIFELFQFLTILIITFTGLYHLPTVLSKSSHGPKARDRQDNTSTADSFEIIGDEALQQKKKGDKKKKKKSKAKTAAKGGNDTAAAAVSGAEARSSVDEPQEMSMEASAIVDKSDSEDEDFSELTTEQKLARLVKGKAVVSVGKRSAEEEAKVRQRRQEAKAHLEVGEKVLARYRGRAEFFPGTVSKIHSDYTYEIHYDDGESETHVPRELIARADGQDAAPAYKVVVEDESTHSSDVDNEWEFESSPLEDSAATGDGGWEMVSATRRKAASAASKAAESEALEKSVRTLKNQKARERRKEKKELLRDQAQEGRLHARWGGVNQRWTHFGGDKK